MQIIRRSVVALSKILSSTIRTLFSGSSYIATSHLGVSIVTPQVILNSTIDLETI